MGKKSLFELKESSNHQTFKLWESDCNCMQNTQIEHLFYWPSKNSLFKSLGFITYTHTSDSFKVLFLAKKSQMFNANIMETIFSPHRACLLTSKETITLQLCTTLRSETFATKNFWEFEKLRNFCILQTKTFAAEKELSLIINCHEWPNQLCV